MELRVHGPVSRYEFENLSRMFFVDAALPAQEPGAGAPQANGMAPPQAGGRTPLPEPAGGKASAQEPAGAMAPPQLRQSPAAAHRRERLLVRVGPLRAGAALGVWLRWRGQVWHAAAALGSPAQAEYEACRLVYGLLRRATGYRPPWGMLTGVRPVRLVHAALAQGQTPPQAAAQLRARYDVSDEKLALALRTAAAQQPFLQDIRPRDYSLYVSIPFCPSRCSYCSFVSRSIEHSAPLVEPYVEALCRELACIGAQAQRLGLRLRTVYIGGGTPTSLTAAQLRRVLAAIDAAFPLAQAQEYTVEAGRPDCTDAEKLALLRASGVSRISVNPQTLQDDVLAAIGRRHTAAQALQCFRQARSIGHDNINMDLIAGLPGDTPAGFADTLAQVLALRPESVTVHALTLKRASDLAGRPAAEGAAAMLAHCAALDAAGYTPYYLYRQKGTVQNLENTGYCLPGRQGLYNIYMMEELHTVLAAGAGAVTKLLRPGGGRVQRVFNAKYPLEYVRGFADILKKKEEADAFYAV